VHASGAEETTEQDQKACLSEATDSSCPGSLMVLSSLLLFFSNKRCWSPPCTAS